MFNLQYHYNPDSINIILAFKDVVNIPGARITIYTPKERSTLVILESKYYKFREYESQLYNYNTANTGMCEKSK